MTPAAGGGSAAAEPAVRLNPTTAVRVESMIAELVFVLQDHIMTAKAICRTACAAAWLVLAAAEGTPLGWAWGVLGVVGTALTYLHAQREWLESRRERASTRWPPLGRAIRRVFAYRTGPHVSPVTVVQHVGLLGLALGTGAPGQVFSGAASTTARPFATVLVGIILALTLSNMTAHPAAWNLGPVGDRQRRLRWMIPVPFLGLAATVLTIDVDDPTYVSCVVGGAALIYLGTVIEARLVDGVCARLRSALVGAAVLAQEEDADRLHSAAKNPARALAMDHLERIEDPEARTAVADLVLRVTDAVDQVRLGRTGGMRNASEVVLAMGRSMSSSPGRVVRVVADLRPEPLEGHDGVLVAALTSDLVSNALARGNDTTTVSLTADHAAPGQHSILTLAVTCACGDSTFTSIPDTGTVGSARRRLRAINGDLRLVRGDDGTHTTVATWPTRVGVEPLPPEMLACIGTRSNPGPHDSPADGASRRWAS